MSAAGKTGLSTLRRQRGQSLVFITITAAVVIVSMLAMYSMGQLSVAKIRLQTTADAAAYSAAVTEARDLNFQAYMNRAMIANQVAVAQMVSMTSWTRAWADTWNGNWTSVGSSLASLSPVMNALWNAQVNSVGKPVSNTAKNLMNTGGGIVTKLLDGIIDALKVAGDVYHYMTLGNMVMALGGGYGLDVLDDLNPIGAVIKANDPNADLSLVGGLVLGYHAYKYNDFTTTMDPTKGTDGTDRMATVQHHSMDGFYHNRTQPASLWPLPFLWDFTRLIPYQYGMLFMLYLHAGGTELKQPSSGDKFKEYAGLDAVGMTGLFMFWFSILGIPIPVPIPIFLPAGSGAAIAGTSLGNSQDLSGSNNFVRGYSDSFGWAYAGMAVPTMFTAFERQGRGPEGANLDTRGGLRAYRDVKANITADKKGSNNVNPSATTAAAQFRNDEAPEIWIEVQKDANLVPTTNSSKFVMGGSGGGQLSLESGENKSMRALASANAYFKRPTDVTAFARSDGKAEYGSLYSPYWQARLKPNGLVAQAAALAGTALSAWF